MAGRRGADVFRLSRRRAISTWPAPRSATSWRAGCTTSRARSPPSATSPTTSRRCSPTCGSSAFWRCAAPMPGAPDMMVAQSAFWVGLLYDDAALDRGRGAAARSDLGGCRGAACRGAARGAGRCLARRHPARPGAGRRRDRAGRLAGARARRCGAGRVDPISRRWRRSLPANQRRQNIGWRATIRRGRVTSADLRGGGDLKGGCNHYGHARSTCLCNSSSAPNDAMMAGASHRPAGPPDPVESRRARSSSGCG